MSVKRNIFANGIANLLSKTVRVADQFLLVPFFLTYWGTSYYGEWLTISAIPSALAFADFGLGTAACNSFVLQYSAGNRQNAANCYSTGLHVISISLFFGIVITSVIIIAAWSGGLLQKSIIDPYDATISILLLMTGRLIAFYSQLFEAFYRSKHKAALSTNLSTIEGFLRIGSGIVVLIMGYGIVAYSLWQFIVTALFIVGYALGGKYLIRDIPRGQWDRQQAVEILKKGLAYFVSPVWQSIYFQGSTFVVRIVFGVEAVAVFNTLRTFSRSINQMYSIINGSVFPEMQIAIGEGKKKLAKKIFVLSLNMSLVSALLGIVFMAIFGLHLYNWWTNNLLQVSNDIWYLFLIGIFFNAWWWTASVVFPATNQPYLFSIYCLSTAVVSIVLSYFLSISYGMRGAVLGYVLLDVMMAILVLPTALHSMQLSFKDFTSVS